MIKSNVKDFFFRGFTKVSAFSKRLIWNAVQNPRVYLIYLMIVLSVFFILFSSYGLITRIRLEMERRSYIDKIDRLQKDNLRLDSLMTLAESMHEIERIAREEYNFTHSGESVFVLESE